MYDYCRKWKKKKCKDTLVTSIFNITKQIRLSKELDDKIKLLANELNQTYSQVFRDILEDFFLDQELIENKRDVEHFLGIK